VSGRETPSSRATHVPVAEQTRSTKTGASTNSIAETVQMVKDYARQETIDPLKTAGRWIGFGLMGAVLIGLATAFLSLGLIRLVQTEWPGTFGGRWTHLAPYGFGLLLCLLVAALAFRRINKDPLNKDPLTKEQR
jgi:hypothetical protein